MKNIITIIGLAILLALTGCATQKPTEVYKSIEYVQPAIDPALFETVKIEQDNMTQESFDKLTLTERFKYLGQRVVNLQSALSIANEQLSKIKKLYEDNEKTLKANPVQGGVLYWEKPQ